MHRFHLPPEACGGPVLQLDERESHHAIDVLRLRAGDEVFVLDGAGREFRCEIQTAARRGTLLRVLETRFPAALPVQVTLFQAVPKGKTMDTIIQKATELGARRVVPVLTEHCAVRLDDKDAAGKQAKWQQVAIEALKQSGAPWLPRVEPPVPLAAVLARGEKFSIALAGALRPGTRHPLEVLAGIGPAQTVAVWIGPEGDFTAAELDAILASGAQPVTLGPLVLRCDTAAVYCLSVIAASATTMEAVVLRTARAPVHPTGSPAPLPAPKR